MKIYRDAFYFKFMKNEYIERTKIEKWVGFIKKQNLILVKQFILLTTRKKDNFPTQIAHLQYCYTPQG